MKTVSYTHLDVYKRQLLDTVAVSGGFTFAQRYPTASLRGQGARIDDALLHQCTAVTLGACIDGGVRNAATDLT